MSSIAKSINLKEITIENNPISLAGDCVSFLVSYLPLLMSLNQLQITEQVRRAANAWRRSKETTDQNFQHLSSDVSSSIRREEIISNARTNWELIRSQQANIINGSQRQNQTKMLSKLSKLTPNNSTSSTSTTESSSSSLTANHLLLLGENGKAIKPNGTRQVMDVSKRQKPKLVRSSSQENTSSIVSGKDSDEFFHLPAVMDSESPSPPNQNPSTASSTRPNVDSESSAFSSDTDDLRSFRSKVPTTPPIHQTPISVPTSPVEIIIRDDDCFTPPPPLPPIVAFPALSEVIVDKQEVPVKEDVASEEPIVARRTPTPTGMLAKPTLTIVDSSSGISLQPTINVEPEVLKLKPPEPVAVDSDKLSTISKNSAKTSCESINTLSSTTTTTTADERQVQTAAATNYHARNRSGVASRKLGPTLVRSQTARNLSSHLNNQQQQQQQAAPANKKEAKAKESDKDREQGERERLVSVFKL